MSPLLETVQAKARPCPEEEARPTSASGCAWHRMTLSTVWVFRNKNFPFFQLMAKVEELNKSMAPAYKLAEQVKEVKRLLELLENVSNSKWRFVKCVELDVRSRDKSVGLEIKILLMCRTRIKDSEIVPNSKRQEKMRQLEAWTRRVLKSSRLCFMQYGNSSLHWCILGFLSCLFIQWTIFPA